MEFSLLQKKLQESLTKEHTNRVEYEAIAKEQEKQLQCAAQELEQYKNFLVREKAYVEKLKGDLDMLQVCLYHTSMKEIL